MATSEGGLSRIDNPDTDRGGLRYVLDRPKGYPATISDALRKTIAGIFTSGRSAALTG